jgi:hypothetical protein
MKTVVPDAKNSVTFRHAMTEGVKNWRRFIISIAGTEVAAVLVMLVLVVLTMGLLALFEDSPVSANGKAPTNPCGTASGPAPAATATPVRVADSTGASGTLAVYSGRANAIVQRQSAPLSVQNGSLPRNACLVTAVSDLVRSDGQAIPASQVSSWALSDNTGTRVTVYVQVSPRFGTVTAAGGYTGTVYLDDVRAVGANVPVNIHVEYPYLWRAAMFCVAAAWAGFCWAWLINLATSSEATSKKFWLYFVLQLAVLLIVSLTVLNALVLTDPDWTGDLSQYLVLGALAGVGALAATPTLRALIDRVVIIWPASSSEAAAVTNPAMVPYQANTAHPANTGYPVNTVYPAKPADE